MDFELPAEATDAAELAATICRDHCTPERLAAAEREGSRWDPRLWAALGASGLLALPLPESAGGAGLGIVEACALVEELGRHLAPVPAEAHLAAAMALADALPDTGSGTDAGTDGGGDDGRASVTAWLARAVEGELSLAATDLVDGETATMVELPRREGIAVLPRAAADGTRLLAVATPSATARCEEQVLSDGSEMLRIVPAEAGAPGVVRLGGAHQAELLAQRLTLLRCARQLGVVDGALALTSAHARTREQFGRPIGTFQAVSQRLADGYIDVLGARLTLWQAAWRLGVGLPAAAEVAEAALWATDAGHRIAHTAVHVHGGVGIDLDGEAHRFFTAAKRGEFLLGGSTTRARTIGRLLAESA